MKKYKDYKDDLDKKFRKNREIKANYVRLVDEQGNFVGELSISEALNKAEELDLDLVEVAPNANPPVCKIIDWNKFKYEYSKKQKNIQKSAGAKVKEVRFKLGTGKAEIDMKIKNINKFLQEKNRVKIVLQLRGKQQYFPSNIEIAKQKVNDIINQITVNHQLENEIKVEGKNICAIIRPLLKKIIYGKNKSTQSKCEAF
ncbi:MAG: translation initiation factor IF-3 [Candidatus Dojkabacteria bacterium]|nr:translation initiation factor IF-3 [Candidatus Dojkabacteria bacterium]